jgi:hypothetical protein
MVVLTGSTKMAAHLPEVFETEEEAQRFVDELCKEWEETTVSNTREPGRFLREHEKFWGDSEDEGLPRTNKGRVSL